MTGAATTPCGSPSTIRSRLKAIREPEVVRGMLEDYRAGLTVDYADEIADRAAGRRVTQPLLVLWSTLDDLEQLYGDPLAMWHQWADNVTGRGIHSPHHIAEHAPDELADALSTFLTRPLCSIDRARPQQAIAPGDWRIPKTLPKRR